MSKAVSSRMHPVRRLTMVLSAIAALSAAAVGLAQPPGRGAYPGDHYGGGYGAPHSAAPRGVPSWGRPPTPYPRHTQAPYPARAPAPGGVAPGGGGPGWNPSQHNGYWMNGRWYSGPPHGPVYQAPGYRPGFIPWRRGAYLPPQYQTYVVTAWGRYHLRRPPVGYNWVQVGNEFLLISASSGLIFDVVTAY